MILQQCAWGSETQVTPWDHVTARAVTVISSVKGWINKRENFLDQTRLAELRKAILPFPTIQLYLLWKAHFYLSQLLCEEITVSHSIFIITLLSSHFFFHGLDSSLSSFLQPLTNGTELLLASPQ